MPCDNHSLVVPTVGRNAGGRRTAFLVRLVDRLDVWIARGRQRRALDELDDRLLRDIGVSRATARLEVAKPFWRA